MTSKKMIRPGLAMLVSLGALVLLLLAFHGFYTGRWWALFVALGIAGLAGWLSRGRWIPPNPW